MTRKYDTILQLAKDTEKKVIRDAKSWMDFLDTAGNFYKYPFKEQILIYAQRPKATACASMELWNQKMNCWVNRGAKGIALIEDSNKKPKLKYVFDLADVHRARRIGRFPYSWKVKSGQEQAVIQHLEKIYGKTEKNLSFEFRIMELSKRIAREDCKEVEEDIRGFVEDSFLEELDELNLWIRIRETIAESMAYLILSGCKLPMEKIQNEFSFEFISEFNTTATLDILGCAIQKQTKSVMLEIKRAVFSYEKQMKQTIKNRSFLQLETAKGNEAIKEEDFSDSQNLRKEEIEKGKILDYNDWEGSRRQIQSIAQKTKGEEERSIQDGTDLQKDGGLSDSRYRDGRTARGRTSEIWPDAETVSERIQGGNLHSTPIFQQTDAASIREAGKGGGTVGLYRKANGEDRGNDRGTQEQRSIGMDTGNEFDSSQGRGNYFGRVDLSLEKQEHPFSWKEDFEKEERFAKERQKKTEQRVLQEEKWNREEQKPDKKDLSGLFLSDLDSHTYLKSEEMEQIEESEKQTKFSEKKASEEQKEVKGFAPTDFGNPDFYKYFYLDYQKEETYQYQKQMGYKRIWASDSQGLNGETYVVYRSEEDLPKFLRDYAREEERRIEREQKEQERTKVQQENSRKGFAPKEKFRQNMEAIQTLQQIEREGRSATVKEREILAKYVGWGGLAEAFDETKENWAKEYQELKAFLSPKEYRFAKESTLNAYYTSSVVIQSMYQILEQMGFTKGNMLEPAMGIGNFFRMLPENMKESRLYGVELDSITGRMARQLFPEAKIQITGFEQVEYSNNFFDVIIGNVPFGNYQVVDPVYQKHHFLIHDYFFAKALDKVRPNGIIALITTKGTMEKQNPTVRRYLAQRAELLGAIRLPNTAFEEQAGTKVTADILFFQKRERVVQLEPDWIYLGKNSEGMTLNQYFIDHPEMILGKMERVSGAYGMEITCMPDVSRSLSEQLEEVVFHFMEPIKQRELDLWEEELLLQETIPADLMVKNYSYTIVDGKIYYRENSIMKPVEVSETIEQRMKGMIQIRDLTQELIALQLKECSEQELQKKQVELGKCYDLFVKKYGRISAKGNQKAFQQDGSYYLICSLEKVDGEGKFERKADIFTKRTIRKKMVITQVDTASEALLVSLSEKARVDLAYMQELTGKQPEEILQELSGVIFQNPVTKQWETADEYLSGNVREKLGLVKGMIEQHPEYQQNLVFLKKVQPKELDASEIEVRVGATWIAPHYIEDFMRELFEIPESYFSGGFVKAEYSKISGQWNIKGKNMHSGNSRVEVTYGTDRLNGFKILEESLNLRDVQIFDSIREWDSASGGQKEKRVLNKKETLLASQKQEALREAFQDWIFRDPKRREELCNTYNVLFNSIRPRKYDGSHLTFPGMAVEITLRPHQLNAVAHQLYGKNTLLAHSVGAGKTFEMIAAAMEQKRLGLCQKSLFVVPNHLTEQWGSDFLRIYPGANLLVAKKKDFEPANRKKFCSRIATGEYDAVIIGHSQFVKIPLSAERQVAFLEQQMAEIERAIQTAKEEKGERYTIKQMEKTKKTLQVKLSRLHDSTKKDSVITFEELGVDRLFVDESHCFKNLYLYTKMRNVAGIAQTEAQKSSDLFAKCQYMDELTGGKGITFATGTPISNSMTELYTNMRYLQYDTLKKVGLHQFDAWASTFGETQTAVELAPEGTGYRAKTRFAKFYNLPELMSLFQEAADIQTQEMLKLPIPEVEYEDVVLKPSVYQKEGIASLAERAEKVRNREVDITKDNLLWITNDGRKLALDQRLFHPLLPDQENSKASVCVEKAFQIWEKTKEQRSTQLIFCDLSTPKGIEKEEKKENGELEKEEKTEEGIQQKNAFQQKEMENTTQEIEAFENLYVDMKRKLIAKGVPKEEIAFIHEGNTEAKKEELFEKVRNGQIRILFGSTAKMGAGSNVQDRLIALHHLEVPWRPSDIEQREGRILRQGNQNPKVKIFRYITEGSFDGYGWQLIENKQKFIGQIMTGKSPVRSCEDLDETALSYAEVKALATGDPSIKEKMNLDVQVSKLKLLKANYISQKYRLEDDIIKHYPKRIAALKEQIVGYQTDIQTYKGQVEKGLFCMKIGDQAFSEKREAGIALLEQCQKLKQPDRAVWIGEYQGFSMEMIYHTMFHSFTIQLKGQLSHEVEIGEDALGNLRRMNHVLERMPEKLAEVEEELSYVKQQLETAKMEVTKSFLQEQELKEKLKRLQELTAKLNLDEKGEIETERKEEQIGEQEEKELLQKEKPNLVETEQKQEGKEEYLFSEEIKLDKQEREETRHEEQNFHGIGERTERKDGRVSIKEKLLQMQQKMKKERMGQEGKKELQKKKEIQLE